MTHELRWTRESFGQMESLIRQFPERLAEMADALKELTLELTNRPLETGESRQDTERVCFFGSLAVQYSIHDRLPLVTIRRVHLRPK